MAHLRVSFRPLSWGLFFNFEYRHDNKTLHGFRPLSWGLFFNWANDMYKFLMDGEMFSSPFLWTFFQSSDFLMFSNLTIVFVPFLGDFFSIV